MNLIDDSIRNSISAAFQDLHDSFKKEITIYYNETTNNVAYINNNPLYKAGNSGAQSKITVTKQLKTYARFYYKTDQIRALFDGNDSEALLSVPVSEGEVKMVVDEEAYQFIQKAERVILDGISFYKKSNVSRRGIFSAMFYNIYLTREKTA